MPELWNNCNSKSLAVLIQLYWDEHGCYPDFYYILSGEKKLPQVIMSPEVEEEYLAETTKFMSQPPRAEGMGGY